MRNTYKNQRPKAVSRRRVFARFISESAVRNTFLESLHSGISPSSKTGDYTDVKVVTPYGEIKWNELSRISDSEMRKLMLEVEYRMFKAIEYYDFYKDNKAHCDMIKKIKFGERGVSWDDPKLDKIKI